MAQLTWQADATKDFLVESLQSHDSSQWCQPCLIIFIDNIKYFLPDEHYEFDFSDMMMNTFRHCIISLVKIWNHPKQIATETIPRVFNLG